MISKPLLAFLILVFASLPAAASPCTEEDREYAEFRDNYYEPEEAYAFGAALQPGRLARLHARTRDDLV